MNVQIENLKAKLTSIQDAIKKNLEVFNSAQANINKLQGAFEAYQDSLLSLEKELNDSISIEVLPNANGDIGG